MLRKHSRHDEGALVEKAGVEANAGLRGAMQRRQEKRSEKEKWAAGRQRLSDWGCELMKKGSDLSGSVGTETSLHLNAPMEETRPYRAPSQSFVPNLQFPILSGWAAALNFNEEKLKILPPAYFPPVTALYLPFCVHPSSHVWRFLIWCWRKYSGYLCRQKYNGTLWKHSKILCSKPC